MNTPEPKAEAMKPYEDCDPLGPLLPSELHQAAMMQQNLISAYGPLGLRSEIAQLKERVQELEKENEFFEIECFAFREALKVYLMAGHKEARRAASVKAKLALSGTAGRSLLERLEKMEKQLKEKE